MVWVVLLIIALVAFFGYNGLRHRHVSRSRYDERTRENVPESISEQAEHKAFHEKHASANTQTSGIGVPGERVPPQRGGPSLLYAENGEPSTSNLHNAEADQATVQADTISDNELYNASNDEGNDEGNDSAHNSARDSSHENVVSASNSSWKEPEDAMDFTAETKTLSSDEVGTPANSSDYDQIEDIAENTLDKSANAFDTESIDESVDAPEKTEHSAQTSAVVSPISTSNTSAAATAFQANTSASGYDKKTDNKAASTAGIAAAGVAAATAGIGIASTQQNASAQQHDSMLDHDTASAEGIDLELGDTGYNAPEDIDDHDELLDFGDLTADISEMLKELNLRETDSPRLEINQDEFAQLKSGEPGEVQHKKIENVAGKLRNMLQ